MLVYICASLCLRILDKMARILGHSDSRRNLCIRGYMQELRQCTREEGGGEALGSRKGVCDKWTQNYSFIFIQSQGFRVPCSVFRPEQYLMTRCRDFEAVKSKVALLNE